MCKRVSFGAGVLEDAVLGLQGTQMGIWGGCIWDCGFPMQGIFDLGDISLTFQERGNILIDSTVTMGLLGLWGVIGILGLQG